MTRLKTAGLVVDLQVLDNEASKDYKEAMVNKWKVKYQLVPLDMHRRNAAERAIRTFKAQFISILAGVDDDFPSHLWPNFRTCWYPKQRSSDSYFPYLQ